MINTAEIQLNCLYFVKYKIFFFPIIIALKPVRYMAYYSRGFELFSNGDYSRVLVLQQSIIIYFEIKI